MCSLQGNGRVGAQVAGTIVRDDVLDAHPHGTIDMHEGLVHSCNAYFAQLAVRVGPQPTARYREPARHLGRARRLGRASARDAAPGRLRSGRRRRDAASHGAGGGRDRQRRSPARRSVEKTANGARRPRRTCSLSPDAAATLGRYLRDAVLTGTGRSLRGHPWRIAGKTGTAEVHGAQSHAWFVGYAPYGPAEKRVAFAVLIENAGYGGAAAAPAAGEIVTAAAASGLVK